MFEILSFKTFILLLTVFLIGSGTSETIQSLNYISSCLTLSFTDKLFTRDLKELPPRVGVRTGALNDAGMGSSNNPTDLWDTLESIKVLGVPSETRIFSGSKLLIVYCILGSHESFS